MPLNSKSLWTTGPKGSVNSVLFIYPSVGLWQCFLRIDLLLFSIFCMKLGFSKYIKVLESIFWGKFLWCSKWGIQGFLGLTVNLLTFLWIFWSGFSGLCGCLRKIHILFKVRNRTFMSSQVQKYNKFTKSVQKYHAFLTTVWSVTCSCSVINILVVISLSIIFVL